MAIYQEPGYSASDVEDGDLTANVVVQHYRVDNAVLVPVPNIEKEVAGNYEIHYSVVDSNGNSAMAIRVVNVQPILYAEPSEDVFLFTNNVIMSMLEIGSGTPIDQLYDEQYFELKYEADGTVIATGTNAFNFLVNNLDEKAYVFTVDKGLPSEQSVVFNIIHYPIDRVYYSTLGTSGNDYSIIDFTAYKNDEAIGDNTAEILDWGAIYQAMIKINSITSDNTELNIYDDGNLILTIPNAEAGHEYTIPNITVGELTVEMTYEKYGHIQTVTEVITLRPSKNVLNRNYYSALSSSGLSDYNVVQQSLGIINIDDENYYGELPSSGINDVLVINQYSTQLPIVEDENYYGQLAANGLADLVIIQQSNTEVN